jgi:hypothetical protein
LLVDEGFPSQIAHIRDADGKSQSQDSLPNSQRIKAHEQSDHCGDIGGTGALGGNGTLRSRGVGATANQRTPEHEDANAGQSDRGSTEEGDKAAKYDEQASARQASQVAAVSALID